MRGLLRKIAQFQMEMMQALEKIPGWPQVVEIARVICGPVVKLAEAALAVMPVLKKAEWLLEIEGLTRRHPVILALSLTYVAWRGISTTPLGHIGTDKAIYPMLGAIGGFNPFLGMMCGVTYGISDLLQKLVYPDLYGAKKWFDLNYWGGMAGYVVAYSSVMLMGLLPGMLSRVFRQGVRLTVRQFAARKADGPQWNEASQGFEEASNPLLEMVAAMAGGAAAGWAVMHEVAPVTERPAFYWRPQPDVSCHNLEVNTHLEGRAPIGGTGAALGGATTVLTPPAPPTLPPPPPAVPDEFEWTMPNGVTTVVKKNEQGQWINILTGGEVDVTNLDKWKQSWADNIRQQDEWRNEQAGKEGWFDKEMKAMVEAQKEKAKAMANLAQIEKNIWFGSGPEKQLWKPQGEPGNILTHIRNMQQQLMQGKMPDREKLNQVYNVYKDQKSGKIIQWTQMPTAGEGTRDIISGTVKGTMKELVTGQKSDGTTSWLGLGGRAMIGIATGGGSEFVFVPANAVKTMKDYVDAGGNSVLGGFGAAVVTVVKDELTGRATGWAMKSGGRVIAATGKVGKELIKEAAENGSSLAKGALKAGEAASAAGGKLVTWASGVANTPIGKKPPSLAPVAKPSGVITPDGAAWVRGTNRAGSTNLTYKPAGVPVEAVKNGITPGAVKHVKMVSDKFGVIVDVRPTTALARPMIESGKALPKPNWMKSKTLSADDLLLGAKGDPGTVGFYKPKMPPKGSVSPEKYQQLEDLFAKRKQEFNDNFRKMYELKQKGQIVVKNGTVYEGVKNPLPPPKALPGKPYAGDNDIFDIRDPVTGRPLPRYQVDHKGNVIMDPKTGQPKLNPVREAVIKELEKPPFNAQHGTHMDWKYDNASKTVPPRSPAGARSPMEISKTVDEGVIGKHTAGNTSGEPLVSYGPNGAASTTVIEGGR